MSILLKTVTGGFSTVVILSGPSGSGKFVNRQRLCKERGFIHLPSITTRKMRSGEEDGRDYHFLTPFEFASNIDAGNFIEYKKVHDGEEYYGTLREPLDEAIQHGFNAIVEVDIDGHSMIRQYLKNNGGKCRLVSIFLKPPSPGVMLARIHFRHPLPKEEVRRRFMSIAAEVRAGESGAYDHVIDSSADPDKVFAELVSYVDKVQAEVNATIHETARVEACYDIGVL